MNLWTAIRELPKVEEHESRDLVGCVVKVCICSGVSPLGCTALLHSATSAGLDPATRRYQEIARRYQEIAGSSPAEVAKCSDAVQPSGETPDLNCTICRP
jgi:hypothetical protein